MIETKVVERSIWIDAPRERVWKAVSEPEQIASWFAPGTTFSFNDNKISVLIGDTMMEVAIVVVFEPPHKVSTRNLPEMTLTTTYTLDEENGGTRFTVTESGYELLSEDERKKRLEQDSAGWEMALKNLQAYIDGRELPRPAGF